VSDHRGAIARIIRARTGYVGRQVDLIVSEIDEAITPVVEMVWVVYDLDARRGEDKLTVYASAGRVREMFVEHWAKYPNAGLNGHQRQQLDAWDELTKIIIGPYVVTCATVQL
jgi:hypothetical protein